MEEKQGYNFAEVEAKWQKYWDEKNIFVFDAESKKQKYYVLAMFLYPSGDMHTGHLRNFSITDATARFKRLRGYEVLHPTGADAFGLPAENAAIKRGIHPHEWTMENLDRIMERMYGCGMSFDKTRVFATCEDSYYGWQQKIFIDLYKNGLAYQRESFVNWDPVDNTVLANEQVVDGRGWRSGAIVEKKKLRQWFFRITNYAEELLEGLKNLDGWSEKVRTMQENWIGKSEGATILFRQEDGPEEVEVYTSRPDTIFGAAFIGISPNHPLAEKIAETNAKVAEFIGECNRTPVDEESLEKMAKSGVDTGLEFSHPFDADVKLPLYVVNFVMMDYGTGAVFGCPAHDERDFEIAKKYGLPIRTVVAPEDDTSAYVDDKPFTENGVAVNSRFLNGLRTEEAKARAIGEIENRGLGTRKINYRIRDWGISRQRYWGCPIPVIHCDKCGAVPERDENLPVKLPMDVVFDGKGNPLDNHPTWKYVKCPECGGEATRETDTMDTFVDSSWYMLRFVDLYPTAPINRELCNRIMPIDQYIGGIEHATMHLIYFRFFTKALRDCGYIKIDEPAINLHNQGMVCHKAYRNGKKEWMYPWDVEERGGEYFDKKTGEKLSYEGIIKMSKSKNNVVDVGDIIAKNGADASRMFVLSDTPIDKDFEWTESGIDGCSRFLARLWRSAREFAISNRQKINILRDSDGDLPRDDDRLREIHKTIKIVTQLYENMEFNRAIAKCRELSNMLEKIKTDDDVGIAIMYFGLITLAKLLSPITPHIAEEVLEILDSSSLEKLEWPIFDEGLTVDDSVNIAIQVNGKVRGQMEMPKDSAQSDVENAAKNHPNVSKFLEGSEVKKVILVPNRLVNLIVG